jgi:hypothetical protein
MRRTTLGPPLTVSPLKGSSWPAKSESLAKDVVAPCAAAQASNCAQKDGASSAAEPHAKGPP